MTVTDHPTQVLIVGGGIAALELLLALRCSPVRTSRSRC
jgi:aspartate oxidase